MALPEIDAAAVDEVLRHAPGVVAVSQSADMIPGHPLLQNLLAAMAFTRFTASFDWQAEFGDQPDRLNSLEVLAAADLEELRKLMTAHIRIDRFDRHHLEALAANGYLAAFLARLATLRGEMEGAPA
ncbi:MAG: DUF6508 domain-containing protein [Pseudomonadota bacterium]|jgi:Family of unknown function (DUF6508)|nr:DUF6508 domain-containing protein [Pseudomonadota bacterium]